MFMQAWGHYGSVWPVLHQQLGVRPDLGRGELEVIPQVPSDSPIAGERIRLGDGALRLVRARRAGLRYLTTVDVGSVTLQRLLLGHTLPRGSRVDEVLLDGSPVGYRTQAHEPRPRGARPGAGVRAPHADGQDPLKPAGMPRYLDRAIAALRDFDGREGVVRAARALRGRLPGDHSYGDPLSVAGDEPPQLIGQRLATAMNARPSAVRELGFGAIQLWQAASEAQGRGRGERPLAILFVDLVRFSDWALEAGDDAALDLLRQVGSTVDPVLTERGGHIVKRLGDGLMAVFEESSDALDAALEASERVRTVKADGYDPELRAGIHFGKPRKLGSDYFGVDVNVAARVADAAGPSQVLVSEAVCERLGDAEVSLRRHWRFKAQGTPKGLKVFSAEVASG